jgi:hypothetical protein
VVFFKTRSWQRWSGPRSEITAALNLASDELQQWSGVPAEVRIEIHYSNHLTEISHAPASLEQVHRTELRRIKDVWIDVKPDRELWLAQRTEYNRREIDLRIGGKTEEAAALVEPPPFVDAAVSLRLARGLNANAAMSLEVKGPNRTSVEGLTTRLVDVLNRSTSGPTNLPTRFGWMLVFPVASFGLLGGQLAVRAFNLAPLNGRYEWQEIVIPMMAAILAGIISAAFAWALPSLELLHSNERSRFQRYRAHLWAGIGAVIASLVAAAIWARATGP